MASVTRGPLNVFLNGVSIAILVLFAGLTLDGASRASVATLDDPAASLARLVGRAMEVHEGAAQLAAWERALLGATARDRGDDLNQAIRWNRDLVASDDSVQASLMLGILLGEAGRTEPLAALARSSTARGGPWAAAGRALAAAYDAPAARGSAAGRVRPKTSIAPADLRTVRGLLPEPWFADTLTWRAARGGEDRRPAAAARARLDARGVAAVSRVRVLPFVRVLVLVVGGTVLLWLGIRRWRRVPFPIIGLAPVPPVWGWHRGVVGALRGGALWVASMFLVIFAGFAVLPRLTFPTSDVERLVQFTATVLSAVVFWFFVSRFLFRPSQQTSATALGLVVPRTAWLTLAALVTAVVALDWIVSLGIEHFAEPLLPPSSWVETFLEDLVFGQGLTLALTALEIVVIAAVVEEFVFRGLVFNTLRARFPFWFAATAASLVFAALHGYGWLGTMQVLAAGFIFAWAFESSGSLWAPILAHALYNGSILVATIQHLR